MLRRIAALALWFAAGMCAAADVHWVGTWGCSPQLTEARNLPPATPGLANHTLRQVVHTSIGGKRIRLRFSNDFGSEPVEMKTVSLALAAGDGVRAIAFHGEASVSSPAEKAIVSDELDYDLAPLTDYALTISLGKMSNTVVTGHLTWFEKHLVSDD